jgi:hypothetical protein
MLAHTRHLAHIEKKGGGVRSYSLQLTRYKLIHINLFLIEYLSKLSQCVYVRMIRKKQQTKTAYITLENIVQLIIR